MLPMLSPRRVYALLFGSGACALIYQVAWFRELRLIFGASTASSSAVLAVFMGGLGIGGALLGKRADKAKNALRLYANLEIIVALCAAVTVPLTWLAQTIYLGVGGASTLGGVGATIVRLLLSIVVLGPATFAMGGTLPSAAQAIEEASDVSRRRVAALYGINTLGAVVGATVSNFLLLEIFGTRLTLWMACLLNLLVGIVARSIAARAEEKGDEAPASKRETVPESSPSLDPVSEPQPAPEPELTRQDTWFPPLAAGVAGGAFMLMELVWYRMLAPILGGSSYTFGLILAVALVGIGIGGALYSLKRRASTFSLFALTCTIEALAIVVPYALGDRLAVLSLYLRPFSRLSFGASVVAWTLVSTITVLPAAIASGFQFPAIIGLYGHGKSGVGRDVGNAYLANTIGGILGALAGGFGLLPLLTAPRAWLLVVVTLLLSAMLAVFLELRRRGPVRLEVLLRDPSRFGVIAVTAIISLFCLTARGPTAVWRHSGIGAGRADEIALSESPDSLEAFRRKRGTEVRWEEDGLESTVALGQGAGYVFIVNGKSDGHTLADAPTQVMSGLLATLVHPDPKSALVIGLGTGSTAGWIGVVPSIDRVDVIELEPAILRVAKDCAPVNHNVLDNPKVHVQLGDARELLRVAPRKYDVIFSEPSNPYRAGISSMYTVEYYRSALERLGEHGVFVQWLQAYEVDGWAVATVLSTLRNVFPSVSVWQTTRGDLLALGERQEHPLDVDMIRARLLTEPYASAVRAVWRTSTAEGVLAHYLGAPKLTNLIVDNHVGAVNTDDQNFLEFAFARSIGKTVEVDAELFALSQAQHLDQAPIKGPIDRALYLEESLMRSKHFGPPPRDPAIEPLKAMLEMASRNRTPKQAMDAYRKLAAPPRSFRANELIARIAARAGDAELERLLPLLASEAQQEALHGVYFAAQNNPERALASIEHAFVLARTDPWLPADDLAAAFDLAWKLAMSPNAARRLVAALDAPFAVEAARGERMMLRARIARRMGDFETCRSTFDAFGLTPWKEDLLNLKVDCLRALNDPRLTEAEDALLMYLDAHQAFPPGAFSVTRGAAGLGPPPIRSGTPPPAPASAGPADDEEAPKPREEDGGTTNGVTADGGPQPTGDAGVLDARPVTDASPQRLPDGGAR